MERYTIGDRNPPSWCKRRLMPYMKRNGSTGFEFHGRGGTLMLDKGDMLIRSENRKNIFVRKKG